MHMQGGEREKTREGRERGRDRGGEKGERLRSVCVWGGGRIKQAEKSEEGCVCMCASLRENNYLIKREKEVGEKTIKYKFEVDRNIRKREKTTQAY